MVGIFYNMQHRVPWTRYLYGDHTYFQLHSDKICRNDVRMRLPYPYQSNSLKLLNDESRIGYNYGDLLLVYDRILKAGEILFVGIVIIFIHT